MPLIAATLFEFSLRETRPPLRLATVGWPGCAGCIRSRAFAFSLSWRCPLQLAGAESFLDNRLELRLDLAAQLTRPPVELVA